jgi:hypothetical protein
MNASETARIPEPLAARQPRPTVEEATIEGVRRRLQRTLPG